MSARATEISIYAPGKQPQVFSLEEDRYEFGRADSSTLCFPEVQGLSRRHALLERDGPRWCLRDLGSTNGTFLNGNRIAEAQTLRSGDRVTIGELTIVFDGGSGTPPVRSDRTLVFVENAVSRASRTMEATLDGVLTTDEEIQGSAHMRALVQAGRELCGHLSLDELFKVIMDLSVDTVGAARGVLITVEGGNFQVRSSKGAGFLISTHVRDLVINERRSLLVHDALIDQALATHESILQQQIRGILAVPLQTENKVIGLIYLDSPMHVKEFTRDDLNVLTVLANIAAIRIEQARLAQIEQAEKVHAKELEHAALIQRSMLPGVWPPFPDRKDFDMHAAMVPAREVGGDLFDFFLLDDQHLAFSIGDVSGKGVPAALFMAMTRTLLRANSLHRSEPGECFTYMNTMLADGNVTGMFVTLFYCVLNTTTGELLFANGGHNPPYLVSADGTLQALSQKSGPMLGVFDGHQYRTHTARIQPGECLALYTDGVTEAVNKSGDFFGLERLERFLSSNATGPAQALVAGLHKMVADFANGVSQADDITVLALRYAGTPGFANQSIQL